MLPQEVAERYVRDGWWRDETLVERMRAICATNGPRTAIIDGSRTLTFGEIAALVERLAGHLAALGVTHGDVVSWQLPNRWEAAVAHLAILRLGAVPNPLNPVFRAREMRFVLAEARPKVLVVPGTWRGFDHAALAEGLRAEGLVGCVVVSRGSPSGDGLELEDLLSADFPAPVEPSRHEPDALALLLYTSGTTGDPKGVQHTHRSLLCELESFREIHAVTPEDRYLGGSPVAHIAGLMYGILAPFALGTSTTLLERWDPADALATIERDRATFQTGPPTFLQTLAEHADAASRDVSSFRLFSTGGASIPTSAVRAAGERLGCIVKRAYGSTEVPTLTATHVSDDADARLTTDGRVIGGGELRIVRDDGSDAAPGEQGEIWARAPEMLAGYRSTALNEAAFAPGGWFRTGDLATVDERGLLRVGGRIKDIIIRGGENISAKEIEDLLCEHPDVSDCAVVGIPDPVLGERACAVVVPRDGATISLGALTEFLEGREIARHKLPERLELRNALPRTSSGKVRKADLRAELSG